ncbi:hypothetical protein [Leptolyngbya sp. FACHB-16]|nr:hypothetical protein [Leptolyngbya sp. FACHB-16]MBD2156861.1 hypothetical protein [Leptolyngbya sp. FACHB-16]
MSLIFALYALIAAPEINPKSKQLGRSHGDWLTDQTLRILGKRSNRS